MSLLKNKTVNFYLLSVTPNVLQNFLPWAWLARCITMSNTHPQPPVCTFPTDPANGRREQAGPGGCGVVSDGWQVLGPRNRQTASVGWSSRFGNGGTLAGLCSFREGRALPEPDGSGYMLLGLQSSVELINQGSIPRGAIELRFYLAAGPDVDSQTSPGLSVSSERVPAIGASLLCV